MTAGNPGAIGATANTIGELIPPATVRNHRRNNLDFLRLFFAVTVIYCHGYLMVGTVVGPLIRPWAAHTVGYFFAISGFLVTASFLSSVSAGSYLKKRALRIFPGYFAAVLVCLLVVVPLDSPGLSFHEIMSLAGRALVLEPMESPKIFARNLMPGSLDGAMWTIRYEFGCYLLVIALGGFGLLKRPTLVLWLIPLITAMLIVPRFVVALRPRYFLFGVWEYWCAFGRMFLIGINAFLWGRKIVFRGIYAVIAVLVAMGALYIPISYLSGLVFDVSSAYVLFYLAFADWLPLHNFGKFGDFSYGTYLYGWPVQQLVIKYSGTALSPFEQCFIATIIAMILAMLSWRLVERPFLRLKPRDRLADPPDTPGST